MISVYELREKMMKLYAENTKICRFIIKYITVFLMLLSISVKAGYDERLASLPVTLGISLICCFFPWEMITAVLCGVLLLHFMKVSIVVALVGLALMIIMILVNLIFSPDNQIVVFLVPLLFFMKIPFLLPLLLGLLTSVTAVFPMAFGIALYFYIDYVQGNAGLLSDATEISGMYPRFVQLVDSLIKNRMFMIILIAFSLMMLFTYAIRRLSIDYARIIAVIIGTLAGLVTVLFGIASGATSGGIKNAGFTVLSAAVSGLIAYIVQFMIYAVDYKRTEYAEFEDDEYHYYVKAVPIVRVSHKAYDKIDIVADNSEKSPERLDE